jgi:hypothetical protein
MDAPFRSNKVNVFFRIPPLLDEGRIAQNLELL